MELQDIRNMARFAISPQLTETDYPDEDLDRNINAYYKKVMGWIIPIQGDWEIAGDVLYRDLEAGVSEYDTPLKLVRVTKAEVMYSTGGSFVPVNVIDIRKDQRIVDTNDTRIDDDVNNPTADFMGGTIKLRPTPTEDVVNGFALYVQMNFTDLIDDDNGVDNVPELIDQAVEAIAIGAAMMYAVAEEMDKKELALKRIIFGDSRVPDDKGLKEVIETIYANRSAARRDRLTSKKQSYK